MYPTPVDFVEAHPGTAGVRLRWAPREGASSYRLYRSPAPVTPEQTEAFYGGLLPDIVTREVDAHRHATVDIEPPRPCWYLVLAVDAAGDLHSVDLEASPADEDPAGVARDATDHSGHNPYRRFPALVFRADDASAKVAFDGIARSLARRFEGDGA